MERAFYAAACLCRFVRLCRPRNHHAHARLPPPPPLLLQTWYFDCNQWFDKTQGDGLVERILHPSLQVRVCV